MNVPSGDKSTSELCSTESEEPGKRKSWGETCKSRWIKARRNREVLCMSIVLGSIGTMDLAYEMVMTHEGTPV